MKISDIFSLFKRPVLSNQEQFVNVERDLVKKFSETEPLQSEFSKSQARENKHRQNLSDIQDQNPNVKVADKSAENNTAMSRLKKRKWLAVGVDALLAISSVQMLFLLLVHIDLSKGTAGSSGFAPILKPLLLGIGVAFALLALAIDFRHDDRIKKDNSSPNIWQRFSWIAPLLFIPFVNLFLVFTHPDSPYNILWIGLAIFSIILNLKVAAYSDQYILMAHTKFVNKLAKPAQEGIDKELKIQDQISSVMVDIKRDIIQIATEFRRLYDSFGNAKPQLALAHPYRFVLNTRVYFQDVLAVPSPQITLPGGTLAEYQRFWDETTRINLRLTESQTQSEPRENTPATNDGSNVTTNGPDNHNEPGRGPGQIPPNQPEGIHVDPPIGTYGPDEGEIGGEFTEPMNETNNANEIVV